ncbi:hypothetical protein K1719_036669 [Acacia pycnantha]|nr:hypothetical protein K1719_036669 [Acacia pycnantha]
MIIIFHKPLLEPVLLPHPLCHLFNRHILGFREQEQDEAGHDQHPSREEQEDPELEVTQHGEESLSYDEGEEHVNTNSHTLSCRASLQRECLTGDEPPKRPPRPSKCKHKSTHHNNKKDREPFRKIIRVVRHFDSQDYRNHNLR